jgi:hypothetical protein
MQKKILLLAVALSAGAANAENNLYREDVAPVIEPPKVAPKVDEGVVRLQEAMKQFQLAYGKNGRPRIVVYWNRVLSDDIEQRKESSLKLRESVHARGVASSESTEGYVGGMTVDEAHQSARREVELVGTTRTIDKGQREAFVNKRQDWAIQSAVLTNLRKAGAKLVDRTMILRNAHLDKLATNKDASGEEVTDVLRTEGKALRGYADILLDVEMVTDAQSPLGIGFKMTARHIDNGQDVVTYYTQAIPPKQKTTSRYVATDRGYQKEESKEIIPTTAQVIDQLSTEILQQFAQGLEQ